MPRRTRAATAAAGPASRVAPHTALTLLLLGAALLLDPLATRRARLAVQILALVSSIGASARSIDNKASSIPRLP